jgi:hypothetical protein
MKAYGMGKVLNFAAEAVRQPREAPQRSRHFVSQMEAKLEQETVRI